MKATHPIKATTAKDVPADNPKGTLGRLADALKIVIKAPKTKPLR